MPKLSNLAWDCKQNVVRTKQRRACFETITAMSDGLENVNPTVHGRLKERNITADEEDDDVVDKIDTREVFDILSLFQFH